LSGAQGLGQHGCGQQGLGAQQGFGGQQGRGHGLQQGSRSQQQPANIIVVAAKTNREKNFFVMIHLFLVRVVNFHIIVL